MFRHRKNKVNRNNIKETLENKKNKRNAQNNNFVVLTEETLRTITLQY